MKNVKKAIAVLVIIATLGISIWCLGEHQSYDFDENLEGQVFTVNHATYLRSEPVKNAKTYDYLEIGSTVKTTGAVSKRDCPSSTCKCGGTKIWYQVVDGERTYWIMLEAIL